METVSEEQTVKPNSRAGVVTIAPLPEENLQILTDPVSPGKLKNWSGIHSSPANTIRGLMRPNTHRAEDTEIRLYDDYIQKGAGSNLFCIAFILFAQGFEKLQIHLRLRRSGFGFALVAPGCSCRGALNFADS